MIRAGWYKLIWEPNLRYYVYRQFFFYILLYYDLDVKGFYNATCPFCRRKFKNTIGLRGHLKYCKPFQAIYKLFLNAYREAISKSAHKGNNKWKCMVCGKHFNGELEFLTHYWQEHYEKKRSIF